MKGMRSLTVLLSAVMLVTALPLDVSGASEDVVSGGEMILEQEEDEEIIETPESEDEVDTVLPKAELEVEEVPETSSVPVLDSRSGSVLKIGVGETKRLEIDGYNADECQWECKEDGVPEGWTYISGEVHWSNKEVTGNVYVASDAQLYVDSSSTINGNIYVYGQLYANSRLTVTDSINAYQYGSMMSSGVFDGEHGYVVGSIKANRMNITASALDPTFSVISEDNINSNKVAVVDAGGVVTGIKEGSATVVMTCNGESQKIFIEVHTYDKWAADKDPTCTETGIQSIHCSVCDAIKEDSETEIALIAHTEVKDEAVSPTCTQPGKTEGSHCSVCNTVIKEQEEIPVISHTYQFDSLTKATLSADGKIIRKCTGCGKTATQILSYPKTITLSNTKYTYNGKVMKPTVTVKGADGKEIHPANYTVSYSPGCKNAGTYNVVITFKANYSGKVTKSFMINKASQTLSAANHTKVYGNAAFFTGARQTKGNGKLSFTSSNPKVATVSSTGKITITGIGRTTITITAAATTNYNKATKAITVTVNPKATFISGIKNSDSRKMSISWNKNGTVTGYQVQYATNDSFSGAKTLTISKNSTLSTSVSNLPKGNTYYVRVRTYKKVYSTTYYSSWSAAKSVKITMGNPYLSKTSISLNAGVKYGLKLCDTTQKAVWSSSNSAVAAVSSSGVVTGKKAGTATVTAKIGGKSYSCKVTVKGSINVTVYWTPGGSVYHSTRDCPSLARSKTIKSGSVSQSGKSRKCKVCY
ncbi:Ig-like domain-containing protein [Ruminococcus gauvreauii]|uniref:Ig-like domain-containing protein n=2 Tax=Ruminococcus gauvreauii TaxID=438033 RepID=A0ABY5VEB3_9FIRM|nr:Ig-like domain-containing protein [Ruminococcus gauvreauii]UWP58343.1 Ig-like domain-containing protein [Ruminococcus gauvreauii]